MKLDNRKSFLKWYDEYQCDPFDLENEYLKYCSSNVDILRKCCLQIKDLFNEMTSVKET